MVSLTLENGAAFSILKENVLKFSASPTGSGSVIFYNAIGVGNPIQSQVNETASAIQSGQSDWFIELTVSGETVYINPTKVVSVSANGSGSSVVFGVDQFATETYSADESASAVVSAINTSMTPVVTLPYTSYVGYVSESGGTATAIELYNDTGLTFAWTFAANVFTATPDTAFADIDKVFVNCGGSLTGSTTRTLKYDYTNSSTASLKLAPGGATIVNAPFEIRIYP